MKKHLSWTREIAAILLGLLFLVPILFAVSNSFKTAGEIFVSFVDMPKQINLDNYLKVWNDMNYLQTFFNTLIITFFSVTATLLLSSMAAYKISRMNSRWAFVLLMFFVLSMMIPFQTIMIPLVKLAAYIHFTNSKFGLIMIIIALFSPFTIFLYRGFIQQVPIDLEEAARIDGASIYQTFFQIVFPLLLPITTTAAILNTLYVWNDFLLSFLLLQKPGMMTLQLMVYRYFGTYSLEWNLALTSIILTAIPVIIFYVILQKYIVKGVTAGALKG
ncbi:carbohydrate ABC transporter permease [Paenibacillus sp. N3.4]|uniref:carbohydrate ABC transporter permease n=1 Tax=Paenibacillus sp. N3.4 TaxID=2603222 RepID=UPI0011C754D1|nr:carbohydrate ABC transporter permease [Paenibacillus sp. N3.4]TXK84560.1 carbohydrate ABC transporter permease [Paenibacillus sp. N3.4]